MTSGGTCSFRSRPHRLFSYRILLCSHRRGFLGMTWSDIYDTEMLLCRYHDISLLPPVSARSVVKVATIPSPRGQPAPSLANTGSACESDTIMDTMSCWHFFPLYPLMVINGDEIIYILSLNGTDNPSGIIELIRNSKRNLPFQDTRYVNLMITFSNYIDNFWRADTI